ncbi:MAG: aminopeptidase [Acidobacteriota bacterium]
MDHHAQTSPSETPSKGPGSKGSTSNGSPQDLERPDREVLFDRYARILVGHGAGLRRGQHVYLHTEVAHRDFALRLAETAYDMGAGHVSTWLVDPRQHAQLIRRGRLEQIERAHAREQQWLDEIVTTRGALISLRGDEDPRLMRQVSEDEPERHGIFTRSSQRKGKVFLHHGVNRSLCPWVVAAAVTPAWARQVFPERDTQDAVDRLWDLVFQFTHADHGDAADRAAEKDRRLHARRRQLDALRIRELRVTGGGSDLRVGLSPKARWRGGSKETAFGQTFNANVPSEENFTTPDRRVTEGRLVATMPFRTKAGLLVKELVMHFEAGRLTHFTASEGAASFERWIDSDDGARYLGEFALVGQDSPIAKSGLFFEHTLLDENAWPHVAIGQAYATALEDGEHLSARELAELGCNTSSIHTDIMFGSPEVSVTASTAEGDVPLIERGRWTAAFLDPS